MGELMHKDSENWINVNKAIPEKHRDFYFKPSHSETDIGYLSDSGNLLVDFPGCTLNLGNLKSAFIFWRYAHD